MCNNIFDSDFYTNAVKREYRHACIAYLLSEPVFMADIKGLGLGKEQLRKLLKRNIKKLKKALLEHVGIFENFFHNHIKETEGEEGKMKLSFFLYDLYNILIMAVYLENKYYLKTQNHKKLDKELLSNNLALSIIEGSAIGRDESFKPYLGRSYSFQRGDIEHGLPITTLFGREDGSKNYPDDFYYAQNTFLQHELLMLVVLYSRDKILPRIYYTKVGQKNIITNDIEIISSSVPDYYLNNHQWSSSLINIITNFDYIMSDLKSREEVPRPVKLANIFFSKEFIDNFDFNKLLQSYIFKEDPLTGKIPTEANITETMGRIIDSRIQEYTNKEYVWSHVVDFTKFFPNQVKDRKNNHINFSDGKLIRIYNDHLTFGITMRNVKNQDRTKLTYEELHNKFRRNKGNATSRVARKRQLHKNKATSREAGKKLARNELRGKLEGLPKKGSTTSQVARKRQKDRRSAAKERHFKLMRTNAYFINTYLF